MIHEGQKDRVGIHELDIRIRPSYNRAWQREARVYSRIFFFILAQGGGTP